MKELLVFHVSFMLSRVYLNLEEKKKEKRNKTKQKQTKTKNKQTNKKFAFRFSDQVVKFVSKVVNLKTRCLLGDYLISLTIWGLRTPVRQTFHTGYGLFSL